MEARFRTAKFGSSKLTGLFTFAAGAIGALSQAPFHLWPILAFSFPVLFLVLERRLRPIDRPWQRFKLGATSGWVFGFGYFIAGLWWVGSAMLVEAESFAWAIPLAVLGLPALLACFTALGTGFAALIWRRPSQAFLALTLGLFGSEWLRGHLLSGFPWNLFGYAALPTTATMQTASVLGIWVVTLLTIAVALAPGFVLLTSERRNKFVITLVSLLIFLSHLAFGHWRLTDSLLADSDGTSTVIRIVQPNIGQREKWQQGNEERIFQTYLELTAKEGLNAVDAVIWPESAFPFLIQSDTARRNAIGSVLPEGVMLLTGAVTLRENTDEPARSAPTEFFNSLLAFDSQANIVSFYHKRRLVPFGEFLPFEDALSAIGIKKLVRLPGGFESWEGNNVTHFGQKGLSAKLPPATVLICYEIIFSGGFDTRGTPQEGSASAEWILNVTNDAWFGELTGPHQHFHKARIRAVEEGLPLIRVANTGISGLIDPYGRVIEHIDLGDQRVIDVQLPARLPTTPYASYGPQILIGLLSLMFTALILSSWRNRKA